MPSVTWEPSDRKLSDAMVTYWANFARTRRSERRRPADVAALRRCDGSRVLHLDETIQAAPDTLRPRYEAIDAFVAKQRIP